MPSKKINIGLNGYGRIGRLLHRLLLSHPTLQVVAINARSEDAAMRAHLLKYDSIHGPITNKIEVKSGNTLVVDGTAVQCVAIKDAAEIPWGKLGVDIVVEGTGKAKNREMAAKHLVGGAKKVLVTAPMKDDTPTFVIGVNEKNLKPTDLVVSNASCTTNCVALPIKLIHEQWGVNYVSLSSIHAVTHSQNLLDNSGRDLRRARSALMSIIPTTTGAAQVLSKIMPELAGRSDGIAYRVPILNSSITELTIHTDKAITKEEVNEFFRKKVKEAYWDPILDVCDEPLVSIDFKGNPHSSIVDLGLTQVTGGHYLKLFAWYDNEWGYTNRLKDMLELMS
ncbi:MAG: glyceraldehyde 3-phosphate dehydrogenase NAD-binding domain-containing protein [Candidatus Peregrinibacteria bacterium]